MPSGATKEDAVHTYTVYYKMSWGRATYIGLGRGRNASEALADFRKDHKFETVRVLKIVLND